MSRITRREFGKVVGAGGASAIAISGLPAFAIAQRTPKVVIVGGGAGGATVAHYVRKDAPNIDVTLIEANSTYSSSFFSNLYIGGIRSLESLDHGYARLRNHRIKVVHDRATDVDAVGKTVRTLSGTNFSYDRLVLSPGIDIKYDSVPGYSREAAALFPHAYNTDRAQKQLLKRQLEAMPDGGVVLMVMPNNPFRCPPGPYERACMIAHYLKTRKPRSKLVILDPKKAFSKQPVFTEAFDKYYKDIIELNLSTEIDDFTVVRLDGKAREAETKAGRKVRFDVANIIPQQRAGEIAVRAGCAEKDWCPINAENFSSKNVKDVYVLGDASIAAEMPKSAFSANSQAKAVAEDILAELAGKERFPARYHNTCWSLLAPDDAVKIGATYAPKDGKLDPSGSFVSQKGEDAGLRKQNYAESIGWYANIIADMFPATPSRVSKG
ncbi:NAD(P)/FAD-dependent oxidoreductase [Bradyrhizobium sp.]|uniref:NAD(P)/FAD-dependent oxidoreductase n=1 Tax=Bradyrhizobium sp. TaxID=376 RepID=UPI000AD2D254|nr:NAD(P)/FAD-dependent oxidoreductase [Bradyrhizobium sp.]